VSAFAQLDGRDAAWNGRPGKGKMGSMGFTFRHTAGRVRVFFSFFFITSAFFLPVSLCAYVCVCVFSFIPIGLGMGTWLRI
jgi:hypothetical protein